VLTLVITLIAGLCKRQRGKPGKLAESLQADVDDDEMMYGE